MNGASHVVDKVRTQIEIREERQDLDELAILAKRLVSTVTRTIEKLQKKCEENGHPNANLGVCYCPDCGAKW